MRAKAACRGAAAGVALPAVFLWLLARGLTPPWAAAWCAAAALTPAACGVPTAGPLSLVCVALGALVSVFVLAPAAGIYWTLAMAAALLLAGRRLKTSPTRGDAAAAAAASILAVALWRCLAFLLGHSLYAAVTIAAAAALGLAAGRAARGKAAKAARWLPGAGPLAGGLLGLLTLEALRLVGLNAAQPEHIRQAVLGRGEALWLCSHAAAGMALAAAALGAFEADAPAGSPAAALTPFIAAGLLPWLTPSGTVVAAALLLCALGAWRGRARWSGHAILSRAVPAALIAAAAIGYHCRRALYDVTIDRLIGVFPGGRIVYWHEAGGRTTVVYRFRSGFTALLRDGVADFEGGDTATTLTRQLLRARGDAHSLLLAGALHPESVTATLSERGTTVSARVYDRDPECRRIVAALSPEGAAAQSDSIDCGRRPPRGPFDAVGVVIPPPFSEPANALAATKQSARRWRRELAPGGVLAWQLPTPPAHAGTARAAAALSAEFSHVLEAPLGAGTLLLASDGIDAAAVNERQGELTWSTAVSSEAAAATDTRPLTALPVRWPSD